jgi:hypothetical protein
MDKNSDQFLTDARRGLALAVASLECAGALHSRPENMAELYHLAAAARSILDAAGFIQKQGTNHKPLVARQV